MYTVERSTYPSFIPGPPDPPGIPDIEQIGDDFISLTWEPPKSDGGGRLHGYIIGMPSHDRSMLGFEVCHEILKKNGSVTSYQMTDKRVEVHTFFNHSMCLIHC